MDFVCVCVHRSSWTPVWPFQASFFVFSLLCYDLSRQMATASVDQRFRCACVCVCVCVCVCLYARLLLCAPWSAGLPLKVDSIQRWQVSFGANAFTIVSSALFSPFQSFNSSVHTILLSSVSLCATFSCFTTFLALLLFYFLHQHFPSACLSSSASTEPARD